MSTPAEVRTRLDAVQAAQKAFQEHEQWMLDNLTEIQRLADRGFSDTITSFAFTEKEIVWFGRGEHSWGLEEDASDIVSIADFTLHVTDPGAFKLQMEERTMADDAANDAAEVMSVKCKDPVCACHGTLCDHGVPITELCLHCDATLLKENEDEAVA